MIFFNTDADKHLNINKTVIVMRKYKHFSYGINFRKL